MFRTRHQQILFLAVVGLVLMLVPAVHAATQTEGPPQGHKKTSGVVTAEKSGLLTVKTPDGSTLTLNPNISRRHGHEVPKVGDELTLFLDENNTVVDVHPKGHEGTHQFITGKLIHLGRTTKQIKLSTPEGEKVFPLERLEVKTKGLEEGAMPTIGRERTLETRRIGSLEVSLVGLGCNNFGRKLDAEATSAVVHAALDAGINFFDTADVYGGTRSEEFLGRALGKRRDEDEVVIATKFGMQIDERRRGASPAYVRQAVEDSLRRLGTDHIDLYQLHQPDPEVPIADALGALDELVRSGKVREIGCSNFSADQLREAEAAVRPGAARFVSVQNEYSLSHRGPERDLSPSASVWGSPCLGIAFLPYFPLASGLLTGKYRRGQPPPEGSRLAAGGRFADLVTDRTLALVESLLRFSTSRGHTLLELAISWLAMRPVVASVIAGATSPQQVKANAAAANWRLTETELAEIDAILSGQGEQIRR